MRSRLSTIAIIILLTLFKPSTAAAKNEAHGIWACQPLHWINLRTNGPSHNPGQEPSFILRIDNKKMSIQGEKSWLNESDFQIYDENELGSIHTLKGKTEWNSQFVFSHTTGEFFHSSANIGVVVSMVGKCTRG